MHIPEPVKGIVIGCGVDVGHPLGIAYDLDRPVGSAHLHRTADQGQAGAQPKIRCQRNDPCQNDQHQEQTEQPVAHCERVPCCIKMEHADAAV